LKRTLETLYNVVHVSLGIVEGLECVLIDAIDHIGIAVKNLDEAISVYQNVLGFKLEGIHTLNERKVKVAFFSLGESRIELLEPLGSDSTVAKFLETRGEGIQHFAVKVKNIEAVLEEFKRKGVTLIDEKPRAGAEGAKIAFVHPKSTRGVLLELVEKP
jgi:methylmalonyl-CoA/ethylmalonyl-CoA epimerase